MKLIEKLNELGISTRKLQKLLGLTLGKIKSFNPCIDGWRKLCKGLNTSKLDTEVSLLQILEINGVKDAYWSLRCYPYQDYCLILADVAESVLHIFEERHPNDLRPRKAIEAIRLFEAGKISKKQLVAAAADAYTAADAAADTAFAADTAADAYTDAAFAAFAAAADAYTAASAAATASYAVADAYAAAASNTASYAVAAAASNASTASVAARKKQREINEEILRKYLEVVT